MRAFIYTGGAVYDDLLAERPEEGDLIVTADAGLLTAQRLGLVPDVALGDFDTLETPEVSAGTELCRVPAEKNFTDTQYAVDVALGRGAREMIIVGGLEGRVDHTLSTLAICEMLCERHVPAILTNGKNRVRFIRNSGVILARSQYRFFSVIAADSEIKGLSIDGAKYPLKRAKLSRTTQWAVSNEIVGNCALIELRHGGAWIIESMD